MLKIAFFLFSVILLTGCSSNSYLARSSTNAMGELSPMGSRQVVRQRQQALASHYRISVGQATAGLHANDNQDLNKIASETLSEHLKHYFVHVNEINKPMGLSAALQKAAEHGDQLLMYPRVERWPNIKPLRVRECEDEQGQKTTSLRDCGHDDSVEESDELVLTIAVFDVVGGMQVDSITARSSMGVKSYLFEDSLNELQVLNEMVVNRLSAQANLH